MRIRVPRLTVRAEFVERSVDATMATMTDAPYVTHVPVMTGGHGRDEVRDFYTNGSSAAGRPTSR
jgi:hypothetical protein